MPLPGESEGAEPPQKNIFLLAKILLSEYVRQFDKYSIPG